MPLRHPPSDVELCAGGAAVLSTLTANDYNHRLLQPARGFSPVSIRASPPPVQGEGAGSPLGRRAGGGPGATFAEGAASSGGGGGGLTPLFGPAPSAFEGSPLTDEAGLTAELFDCGAGAGACVGAAGKACLLMRENHTDSGQWLCQKVGTPVPLLGVLAPLLRRLRPRRRASRQLWCMCRVMRGGQLGAWQYGSCCAQLRTLPALRLLARPRCSTAPPPAASRRSRGRALRSRAAARATSSPAR